MVAQKAGLNEISVIDEMDSGALANNLKSFATGMFKNTAVLARNHFMLIKLSRLLGEAKIKH